jgi:hypothetical protein
VKTAGIAGLFILFTFFVGLWLLPHRPTLHQAFRHFGESWYCRNEFVERVPSSDPRRSVYVSRGPCGTLVSVRSDDGFRLTNWADPFFVCSGRIDVRVHWLDDKSVLVQYENRPTAEYSFGSTWTDTDGNSGTVEYETIPSGDEEQVT